MDYQASLDQLEQAAQVILAPPNLTSKEHRTACEQVVLNFRRTRSAFELCKFIIEKSRSEFVLFETAQLLRDNLIQEWERVGSSEIVPAIAQTILNILLSSSGVPFSVEQKLAGVMALIVKHQYATQNGQERTQLVAHLQSVMTVGGHALIVSCRMLEALISEHQFVVHVSDHSLPYESHFAAKKDFENTDLLKIMKSCLHYLSSYQLAPGKEKELESILKLTETIFYWNFTKPNLPRRIVAVLENEMNPTFKPPTSWAEIITDPGFVTVFFDIHEKVRGVEELVPKTINLMIQLISMHGPLVSAKESRVEFLSRLLPRFTPLLTLPNKKPFEVLGLSDVVRKILLFHRTSTLCALNTMLLHSFLKAVGSFSCQVLQQGVIEEWNPGAEDRVFRDSSTRVLEAWMNILTDSDEIPKELLIPICTDIFNTYLYGRISAPEGYRPAQAQTANEMDDGGDERDTVEFADQLQAIGLFARFVVSHSIPLLTNLLTFKCQAFQNHLQRVIAGDMGAKETLSIIYEDLHWTLLIAGYTISFEGIGETNLIPPEVVRLSISSASNTERSVAALQGALNMQMTGEDSIDPVVKLVCSVISLCEMERRLMESNMGHLLSPEVSSNVIWFLHRWAQVYFLFTDDNYGEMSDSFRQGWGEASTTASMIQTTLLQRIRQDLTKFSGEDDVIRESINLLYSLINSQKKALSAMQSVELIPLIQLTGLIGTGPGRHQMSDKMYRQFMRSMMLIGNWSEPARRGPYWDQILVPLTGRYENFSRLNPADRHREDVRLELSSVLSGFIGVAMSSESRVASSIFPKLSPVASQAGAILGVYHNYTDLVSLCLELITDIGKRSLSYLSRADSMVLYEAAMSVIKAYTANATGRYTTEKSAEEDTYNDLVLLMEMLISLMTKDFLDLGPDAHLNVGPPPVAASEVALSGLESILPLMNANLLAFPNLSSKYFRLVTFLSELHSDKLVGLNQWMLQNLFESVKLGLTQSVQENFNVCCDFIMCLVNYISRSSLQATPAGELVKPFLKVLMDMILLQDVGKDSIPAIACALVAMISAYQELFLEYARNLIATLPSEQKRTDLSNAFGKLTESLNLNGGGDRNSRVMFRERLEGFIHFARGCID